MDKIDTGEMDEQWQFYAPPTGASDSEKDAWGNVSQTTSATVGTAGDTVWGRFRQMGAEQTIRAGGEAAEDMGLLTIHYRSDATEYKDMRRLLDGTHWDVIKAQRQDRMDAFMHLTLKRSKS